MPGQLTIGQIVKGNDFDARFVREVIRDAVQMPDKIFIRLLVWKIFPPMCDQHRQWPTPDGLLDIIQQRCA